MIFDSLRGLVKKRQEHKKKGEQFKIWRNTDTEARKHNAAHTYTMQQGRRRQKKTNIRIKGERSTTTDYVIHIIYKRTDYPLFPPYIRSLTLPDLNKLFCGPNAQDYK